MSKLEILQAELRRREAVSYAEANMELARVARQRAEYDVALRELIKAQNQRAKLEASHGHA
jgi:hypothetical protein